MYSPLQQVMYELQTTVGDFGIRDWERLNKSLNAATGSASLVELDNMTQGRAIQLENVQKFLVKNIFTEKEFDILKLIDTESMTGLFDRYTRQTGYGYNGGRHAYGVHQDELTVPSISDVSLKTTFGRAKFMRIARSASHVIQSAGNKIVDEQTLLNDSASLQMLEAMTMTHLYGDSSLIDEEYDGLIKIASDINDASVGDDQWNRVAPTVYDMSGSTFDYDDMNQILQNMKLNRSWGSNLILPIELKSDIDERWLENTYRITNDEKNNYLFGHPLEGFKSSWARNGQCLFNPTRFLESGDNAQSKAPTAASGTAPSIPSGYSTATGASADSNFTATYDGKTLYYKVVGVTKDGAHAAQEAGTATVSTGDAVTLSISAPASGTVPVAYQIYRSHYDAGSYSDCRYIGSVAAETDGSAEFIDYNDKLPGTADAILIDVGQGKQKTMSFRQLLPFSKIALPFAYGQKMSQTWVYVVYGYLRMNLPAVIHVKNIKVDKTYFDV